MPHVESAPALSHGAAPSQRGLSSPGVSRRWRMRARPRGARPARLKDKIAVCIHSRVMSWPTRLGSSRLQKTLGPWLCGRPPRTRSCLPNPRLRNRRPDRPQRRRGRHLQAIRLRLDVAGDWIRGDRNRLYAPLRMLARLPAEEGQPAVSGIVRARRPITPFAT